MTAWFFARAAAGVLDAQTGDCESGRRTRRAPRRASPCSEPSSTTTTSYSEASRVWSAKDAEARAQQVGPLVGGDEDADPRRGRRFGPYERGSGARRGRAPRSGARIRGRGVGAAAARRSPTVTSSASVMGPVRGAGADREHRKRGDVVDLAGDGAEVPFGDRWAAGGTAGVRGLQPVDVERDLGRDRARRGSRRGGSRRRGRRRRSRPRGLDGAVRSGSDARTGAGRQMLIDRRDLRARGQLGEQSRRRDRSDAAA